MKIVIFGAGEAGAEAVQLIGKENIDKDNCKKGFE